MQHPLNVHPHFSREAGWGMERRPGDADDKVFSLLFFTAFLSCSCLRHKQQVWQLPKPSPEPRYSFTRCSRKGNPEFYLFPNPVPPPTGTASNNTSVTEHFFLTHPAASRRKGQLLHLHAQTSEKGYKFPF